MADVEHKLIAAVSMCFCSFRSYYKIRSAVAGKLIECEGSAGSYMLPVAINFGLFKLKHVL